MTIRRDDLDAGRIDLSEVAEPEGRRLGPVHPGDVLKHDYLEPLGLSVYALAGALGVSRSRMNDIVLGRRSVTAETALRLGRFFATTPDFWLGLQAGFDLETTKAKMGEKINAEVHPRAA
jgi:addiction module HigA family antidote